MWSPLTTRPEVPRQVQVPPAVQPQHQPATVQRVDQHRNPVLLLNPPSGQRPDQTPEPINHPLMLAPIHAARPNHRCTRARSAGSRTPVGEEPPNNRRALVRTHVRTIHERAVPRLETVTQSAPGGRRRRWSEIDQRPRLYAAPQKASPSNSTRTAAPPAGAPGTANMVERAAGRQQRRLHAPPRPWHDRRSSLPGIERTRPKSRGPAACGEPNRPPNRRRVERRPPRPYR